MIIEIAVLGAACIWYMHYLRCFNFKWGI